MKPLKPILFALLSILSISACNSQSSQNPETESPAGQAVSNPVPAKDSPTAADYAWTGEYDWAQSVEARIAPPASFKREAVEKGSFAWWLRGLPLKPGKPDVLLHNGAKKGFQGAHHAVIRMDVGKRDLQQCADAVMRLRAEYLYSQKRYPDIHFNFTSGDRADYVKYKDGYRAKIQGNKVSWHKNAQADGSHANFRKYMDLIFSYCGTASLEKEMHNKKPSEIEAGDVFIQGGFPGHAVIVVDIAKDPATGKKVFLLAQSYMPAQEMHILRNPRASSDSPWYYIDTPSDLVETPEWTFRKANLKSFD